MRLFIGCAIPDEIATYVQSLRSYFPNAHLVVPSEVDLTMKFFGTVPDDRIEEMKRLFSTIHFAPFEASLEKLHVFQDDHVRVLWVGVEPTSSFHALKDEVDKSFLSFFPKNDRFVPHLTVGRVKSIRDKKEFLDQVDALKVEPKTFPVKKLILFKSELSQHGAHHQLIMEKEESN